MPILSGTCHINQDGSVEVIAQELVITKRTLIRSIVFDCYYLVDTGTTFKVYEKIDGTNYRALENFTVNRNDTIHDSFDLLNGGCIDTDKSIKVTVKPNSGGGSGVDLPYRISYDDTLDDVYAWNKIAAAMAEYSIEYDFATYSKAVVLYYAINRPFGVTDPIYWRYVYNAAGGKPANSGEIAKCDLLTAWASAEPA
jgi:hypothetical protein